MQELRTYYYQDGNTVRKPEFYVAPARALPTREQREREKREAARINQKITDRRRAAELRKQRFLTNIMLLSVIMLCTIMVGYVYLQTSVSTKMKHVASLKTELSDVKADNKAAESRIATTINLGDIKEKAINDLGMVYATSSQIVYYSVDSTDFMSQYYDIP